MYEAMRGAQCRRRCPDESAGGFEIRIRDVLWVAAGHGPRVQLSDGAEVDFSVACGAWTGCPIHSGGALENEGCNGEVVVGLGEPASCLDQ